MKKRRIAVVTGSRAEYGHLRGILTCIEDDKSLDLALIVTGSHLSPRFGLTVREIEDDGFRIAARVKVPLSSDTDIATARAMGSAITGLAEAYQRLRPDVLVVLGDRYEIHAAAAAAVPFRIPIAHIHGGESAEGAMDEQFRHSITKLSHIHFPVTEEYKRRIIAMGEDPRKVFCYGSPGLDGLRTARLIGKKSLMRALGIQDGAKVGVVTYHPVTLGERRSRVIIGRLLSVLGGIRGIYWVFTASNSDAGGRSINDAICRFAGRHPGIASFRPSLGRVRYLSLLRSADVMVGNSSSGIIEAPEFELPVVNIGDRQRGRVRAANVIDADEYAAGKIRSAIRHAMSSAFRQSLRGMSNPYKGSNASRCIVRKLKELSLDGIVVKRLYC